MNLISGHICPICPSSVKIYYKFVQLIKKLKNQLTFPGSNVTNAITLPRQLRTWTNTKWYTDVKEKLRVATSPPWTRQQLHHQPRLLDQQ